MEVAERQFAIRQAWDRGQKDDARRWLQAELSRTRDLIDEFLPWAVLVAETDGPASALPLLEQAVRLAPDSAPAQLNLGVALAQTDQPQLAVERLRRAVELQPGYVEGHFNLGNVLNVLKDPGAAEAAYRTALRLQPQHAGTLNNLGLLLLDQSQPHEAVVLLRQATRLEPRSKDFHNNLGLALADLRRWSDAEVSLEAALAIDPGYAEAHANLAGVWKEQGELEQALAGYDLALRLQPDSASSRYNRSLVLLQMGRYPEGFVEYDWRWSREKSTQRHFACPRWQGEPLRGRSILLWCEQGLGDAIQFVRMAGRVRELGAQVVLEAPPPLVGLFASYRDHDQLLAEGEALPPTDYHCPLMSVPGVLGLTTKSVAAAPYLHSEAARIPAWQARLDNHPGRKIGLVWQGNPRHKWDRYRSCRLDELLSLARAEQSGPTTFVSLQQGAGTEQLVGRESEVLSWPSMTGLRPFEESAALLICLDELWTVDTALAHLAGALGIPTAIVLRPPVDWRWLLHRSDSPWYPSVRLVRQGQDQ